MAAMTADEHQRIRDLHAEGKSLTAIANELGRSKDTIHKFCGKQTPPLTFSTEGLADANRARRDRAQLLRGTLEIKFLEKAHTLADEMHQPAVMWTYDTQQAKWVPNKIPAPEFASKARLAQAAGTLAARALDLAKHDSGENNGEAETLIAGLVRGLRDAD